MPRAYTRGRPWTERDDLRLEALWGTAGTAEIGRKLARTPSAIVRRAQCRGLGAVRVGKIHLAAMCAETGYDKGRILKAAARLGLKLQRIPVVRGAPAPRRRPYAITDGQRTAILGFLAGIPDGVPLRGDVRRETRTGEWGTGGKPAKCIGSKCRTPSSPHASRGRCRACWQRQRRAERRELEGPKSGPRKVYPRRADSKTWGIRGRPEVCRKHGLDDRPHFAGGYCKSCYYSPATCLARASRRAA